MAHLLFIFTEGSYYFSWGRYIFFGLSNNGYVGFYELIVFKMFMPVLLGFMRLFWYDKSIKRNCSINCQFFYTKRLVHIVLWRLLVEYQDILKQECIVWVEVEYTYSMVWPILRSILEKFGNILVLPTANAQNQY